MELGLWAKTAPVGPSPGNSTAYQPCGIAFRIYSKVGFSTAFSRVGLVRIFSKERLIRVFSKVGYFTNYSKRCSSGHHCLGLRFLDPFGVGVENQNSDVHVGSRVPGLV